jgi:hypothetical protein
MLLDLVDNLTHSSYIAHSWDDAAGYRVWVSFEDPPDSIATGAGDF